MYDKLQIKLIRVESAGAFGHKANKFPMNNAFPFFETHLFKVAIGLKFTHSQLIPNRFLLFTYSENPGFVRTPAPTQHRHTATCTTWQQMWRKTYSPTQHRDEKRGHNSWIAAFLRVRCVLRMTRAEHRALELVMMMMGRWLCSRPWAAIKWLPAVRSLFEFFAVTLFVALPSVECMRAVSLRLPTLQCWVKWVA